MEPALIGTRLASSVMGPLVKKLFVSDGPGAGLTGHHRRIRLSSLVSFRGEKRSLTEKDVRKLAATLVQDAVTGPGEPPFPPTEAEPVTEALTRRLLALGDLDMDDVQAVRLGHQQLATRLRTAAGPPDGFSTDAARFLDTLTEWACLHILQFFTQRSTFVARALVEQARGQDELIARTDLLLSRLPTPLAEDAAFERRYHEYIARKHGQLTIYGIDLHNSPDRWPLDGAYLSLEALETASPEPRLGEPWIQALPSGPLPADQALAQHGRVLLRGVAGSGKSTLVQWLAVSASPDATDPRMSYLRDRVPLVLPLRILSRHGERLPTPDRFLSAAGCPLTPPDGWVDRVLSTGRGLVLIDGIDEVPEPERERARRWLRDLLALYEGPNRWLVTSRPSAVRDEWLRTEGFTDLSLTPMGRAETAAFVHRWHTAAGEDAPHEQALLSALRTKQDLARLATNPLMCGLICALHRDRRGFLPRGRKALYDAALDMLLVRRDRERDMGTPTGVDLTEASQIRLLQRLAYWLTVNGRHVMDGSRALALITEAAPAIPDVAAIGDPEAVFRHLLHRSGLLRAPTADTVDFVHRTFKDYLAAKALVETGSFGLLAGHAADDEWEDVIRLAVAHGRPRDCADIVRDLLAAAEAAPDRRTRLRVLCVTAASLDQAAELDPALRQQVLDRTAEVIPAGSPEEARELAAVGTVVLDLLPGPDGLDDEQARMAVIAATHIESDAALPYLARFVRHPSLGVRSQLVWAWHRFDTTAYGDEIITPLDMAGLQLTVASDDHADAIVRMGLHPANLDVRREVSEARLSRLLAHHSPTELRLWGGQSAGALRQLGAQSALRYLAVHIGNRSWSVGCLPPGVPLNQLRLLHSPSEGFAAALRLFPTLRTIGAPASAIAEEDWRAMAELPHLEAIALDADSLAACPADVRLEGVKHAVVGGASEEMTTNRLAEVFPSLRRLTFIDSVTVDLSHLANLPHLEHVTSAGSELRGRDLLPPHVRVDV
ncbi:NACHT domain-containing protein [Streptomyces lichenis]|uniref:NACHT domain-containing protein n=1 Tax=Streptomyces lichenis TaxID=2306967 RepID=A0ABT0I938_9ACTN|nr:NACHT domain-containing protein [Streptomyces lichenis]MCK8677835.1 NACHT domain-containing protein [Streptomyces lichenis]